ncbi:MAG: hypothetical protein ABC606_04615 [Candidatus Methanosuratincola petrocarbonis]
MTAPPPPGRNGNAADIDYLFSFFPDVPRSPASPREVMTKKTGGQVQVSSKKELLASEGWKPYLHPREGVLRDILQPPDGAGREEKAKEHARIPSSSTPKGSSTRAAPNTTLSAMPAIS